MGNSEYEKGFITFEEMKGRKYGWNVMRVEKMT